MKISEYIPEYEKMTGKPVSPVVERFAEGVDWICEKAECMGREDADKGETVLSVEAFRKWINKALRDDSQLVNVVAEFIYDAYLNSYNAGRVAV